MEKPPTKKDNCLWCFVCSDDWKQLRLRFLPEKVFICCSLKTVTFALPQKIISFNSKVHLIDKSAFLLFQHLSRHTFVSDEMCVCSLMRNEERNQDINCRSISLFLSSDDRSTYLCLRLAVCIHARVLLISSWQKNLKKNLLLPLSLSLPIALCAISRQLEPRAK